MTRNIDELNNLNRRSEEPEEYFKKMDLPEEEKKRRVEYTKKANEIFDLILVLALLSDDKSPSFFASLRDRLETYLITLINEYTIPDDYLIDYASDTAFNFVDTTEKRIDDPWYTSEDRALFNAENGANDVLNYDLYMKAIADGKTHKKWITEKDNRVRKTHRPLDGKTIGIKELFYVGGIPMRFPKDYEYAEAFPQELINCRCSIVYLPRDKEDEKSSESKQNRVVNNNTDDIINTTNYKKYAIKTEEDLAKLSSSKIANLDSQEKIIAYFNDKYNITIEEFATDNLLKIKAPLAGLDDMLTDFPELSKAISRVKFDETKNLFGEQSFGIITIGKKGLSDYGTGVHEAAHTLDWSRSYGKDYYETAMNEARKNLGLTKKSPKYRSYVYDLFNQDTTLVYNERELFAYFMETSKVRKSNAFANELYRVVKGYKND